MTDAERVLFIIVLAGILIVSGAWEIFKRVSR